MTINVDLLGLAGAEYCEHNGVKGVFIPEVPNFKYQPGTGFRRGAMPPRAPVTIQMYKTYKRSQRYDWMGRQTIPREHLDTYLANPNTVGRKRYCAYGYNFAGGRDESEVRVSDASDFDNLLGD